MILHFNKNDFQGAKDPPLPFPSPSTSPPPNTVGRPLSQVCNKQLGAICPLIQLLTYSTLKYVTFI